VPKSPQTAVTRPGTTSDKYVSATALTKQNAMDFMRKAVLPHRTLYHRQRFLILRLDPLLADLKRTYCGQRKLAAGRSMGASRVAIRTSVW
jgi:hypothetical protein